MSEDDGRHDFDFVAGVWLMHHRKLVDVLDPACDEWVEFESVSTGDIRLYGLGNTDRMLVSSLPPDEQAVRRDDAAAIRPRRADVEDLVDVVTFPWPARATSRGTVRRRRRALLRRR